MDNEMTRIANDLEEKLRRTTAERNVFKAKYRSLITLVELMRSSLRQIADETQDEGDRVYFGSTNHADALRDMADKAEMWVFDYELPPGDINKMEKDPYAEIRRLREENEVLRSLMKSTEVTDEYLDKLWEQFSEKSDWEHTIPWTSFNRGYRWALADVSTKLPKECK